MRQQIMNAFLTSQEIILLDECIFSSKYCQRQAWAPANHNVTLLRHLVQQPCLAVIAAVSAERGMIDF